MNAAITGLSLWLAGVAPPSVSEEQARAYDGPTTAPDATQPESEVAPDAIDPPAPAVETPAKSAPAAAHTPHRNSATEAIGPPPIPGGALIPSDGALVRAEAADEAVIMPTILAEVDMRKLADDVEGYDGFGLGRFRMGMRAQPAPWLSAAGAVEFVGGEHPYLLDGLIALRPAPWVAITFGYSKPPLFASFRHEPVHAMPLPDRALVVERFFVRRDVGIDVQFRPSRAPIEAIVRVGNGASSIVANDDKVPTGYAAIDLVLGRAWAGGRSRTLGLRLGVSGMLDKTREHDSISGATPWGFVFWRPTPAVGRRALGEAHFIGYAGPVRLVLEGAVASEARARDDDGNADTPRVQQDDTVSWGVTAELAWTILGHPREVGRAPRGRERADQRWGGGALELAGRFDRVAFGVNADDVDDGGATGGAIGLKWWPVDFLAVAAEGDVLRYDDAPVESPGRTLTWLAMLRTSFFWGFPGQSNRVLSKALGRAGKPPRRRLRRSADSGRT